LGWSAGPRGANLFGMTTDQLTRNKHLVESFIQELFTKGDLTAVDRYLAVDFVNHDPPFPGAADGAEGMRQAAEDMRAAVPSRG
jgi:predicted SnoaL-like aldol condensation-catalyzing enzyme